MEDGGLGYIAMGFDPFGTEEEQGADQARDGDVDTYELEVDVAVTEMDSLVDEYVTGWDLGVNPKELELSAERVHTIADSAPSSLIQDSTPTTEDTSPSTDSSPEVGNTQKFGNNDIQSTIASKDTPPAEEWFCQFPSCGESFTHRHKLNRHKKYHFKPYHCLESSCATRRVSFSLEKDLVRHQSKHNGRRFYCDQTGCSYALHGTEGGFTRSDDLKRHKARRH